VRTSVHEPEGSPLRTTLPVATEHVGWDITPITGADGVAGWVLITTLEDAIEVHPLELVTVKLYVPGVSPEIVVLVVDPVTEPGLIVQVPAGKLVSITLPVATVHVGCVIVPATGAEGVGGCAGITTFADNDETQPAPLVTVKLWVPDGMPETVVLVPLPVVGIAPGYRVRVHVPVAGKPLRITLPVDKLHVGGVIVPTTGGAGVGGCAGITTLADAGDVHPVAFVTVKVYVFVTRFETVVLVPSPVFTIPPGVPFNVQVPVEGNPFRTTLPVEEVHVGGVIVPTEGVAGNVLTVTVVEAETALWHPFESVILTE
jgi:hypothetical protein